MTDRSESNSTTPGESADGEPVVDVEWLTNIVGESAVNGEPDLDDESFNVDIDAAALPLPVDLNLAGRVIPSPSEPVRVVRVVKNRLAQMGWHIVWWGGKVFIHNPGSGGSYVPLGQGDDDKAVSSMILNALEPALYERDDNVVPWNPTPKTISEITKAYELKSTISSTQETNFWMGRRGREIIREALEQRYPGSAIGACFDEAMRPRGDFEPRPIFINTRSGILWCRYETVGDAWEGDGAPRRIMLPHTPDFFTTTIVDCEYDPEADDGWGGGGEPRRWLNLVMNVFDDPEGHVILREWFGYLVSGRKDLEKMLFLVGPTRSGKGTIAEVMELLMGGVRHVLSTSLKQLATNKFVLAGAVGKRLIMCPDAEITAVDGSGRSILLSLSSTDTVPIEPKGKQVVSMKLPSLVVVVANKIPKFNDPSGALAERMIILQTAEKIEKSRRDPGLKHHLTTHEMTGIFHWALHGLDQMMRQGATFTESAVMEDHIESERARMAGPVYQFAQEWLVFGPADKEHPEFRMNHQALHEKFNDWVMDHGIQRVNTDANSIIEALREFGHKIVSKKTVRHPSRLDARGHKLAGAGSWGLRFKTDEERAADMLEELDGV